MSRFFLLATSPRKELQLHFHLHNITLRKLNSITHKKKSHQTNVLAKKHKRKHFAMSQQLCLLSLFELVLFLSRCSEGKNVNKIIYAHYAYIRRTRVRMVLRRTEIIIEITYWLFRFLSLHAFVNKTCLDKTRCLLMLNENSRRKIIHICEVERWFCFSWMILALSHN